MSSSSQGSPWVGKCDGASSRHRAGMVGPIQWVLLLFTPAPWGTLPCFFPYRALMLFLGLGRLPQWPGVDPLCCKLATWAVTSGPIGILEHQAHYELCWWHPSVPIFTPVPCRRHPRFALPGMYRLQSSWPLSASYSSCGLMSLGPLALT